MAEPCRWCGAEHGPLCPYVKALEFSETNGAVTRVEFLTPLDIPPELRKQEQQSDYPKLGPQGE